MILAIDCSGKLGLVSLELPGGRRLERSSERLREHADFLARSLAELQGEAGRPWAELDRVAVAVGPGSFTGLRVALAAAKGLIFGTEVPLLPLPSLAVPALACEESARSTILLCRHARGEESWAGLFLPGRAAAEWERLLEPEALAGEAEGLLDAGAASLLVGELPASVTDERLHSALKPEPPASSQLETLARLAREGGELISGAARDDLLPRYLLGPAVTRPRSRGRRRERP